MMPVVFRIPFLNWDIPGYGLMLMFGFMLSVIWAARRAARSGANPDIVLNCAFIALIGGVAGARLMFVVHYWEQFAYRGSLMNIILAVIDVRKGGLEVYGGVLCACLGAVIYLAARGHSVRWYMDIMAPSTALGMGIGRIGCFLNGCCWGAPCELPWAVEFPYGSNAAWEQWYDGEPGTDLPKELIFFPPNGIGPDGRAAYPISREILWLPEADIEKTLAATATARARIGELQKELLAAPDEQSRARIRRQINTVQQRNVAALSKHADIITQMQTYGLTFSELREIARARHSLPVHPTQLYSMVVLVLLALVLSAVYWRRTRDGQVICTLLLIEPVSRYALEVIRADNPIDTLGAFTISQFIAIMMTLTGLVGLLVLRQMSPRSKYAQLWEPPEEETAGAGKKKTAGAKAGKGG
ncbi:MAG: prolipoprotein diacylglyceryl transferase family protein [Planctomycetota bacterium]